MSKRTDDAVDTRENPFDSLPHEVMVKILAIVPSWQYNWHCRLPQCQSCPHPLRATCRTFRYALDSEVTHLSAHNTCAVLTLDDLVAKIVRCSPSLRSLHLHALYVTNPTALSRLMGALRQCRRLEVLWTIPLTARADMPMDLTTLPALRCVMVPVPRMLLREIQWARVAQWAEALCCKPKGTHSLDSSLSPRAKGSLVDGPLPHGECVFVHSSRCPGSPDPLATLNANTTPLGFLIQNALQAIGTRHLSQPLAQLAREEAARQESVTMQKIATEYVAVNWPVTLAHVRHILVPHGARRLYMLLPHVRVADDNQVCIWVPPRWCAEVRRWLPPRMEVCALIKARTLI